MNYKEMCYWNAKSYGTAIQIKKHNLVALNLLMAVIIPIIYPIPLAAYLSKYIKTITIRYEK